MPPRAAVPVPPLSQVYVQELFDYNPENGELKWKVQKGKRGSPGKLAGHNEGTGKGLAIQLDYRRYAVASVIWVWMTGYWPVPPNEMIDHIDRNKINNRWNNLRLASTQQNNWNSARRLDNTTGYKGVYWDNNRQLYTSRIKLDGKLLYLGAFVSPEDASKAYQEAVIQHRGKEFSE